MTAKSSGEAKRVGMVRQRADELVRRLRSTIAQLPAGEVQTLAHDLYDLQLEMELHNDELGGTIDEHARVGEAAWHERGLLRTLMENIPETVFFKDLAGRFVRISRSLARFWGLADPREAEGTTDFDFYPAEDAKAYQRDEQELIRTGTSLIDKEEQCVAATGEARWFSTTKVLIKDGEGRALGIVGLSRDITDHKQAEEALRESELRLRQLAENINEVFWLTDWMNRKVIYVSPAYESIYDQPRQRLYDHARSWADNIHPDDKSRAVESFERNAEAGRYDEEYRVIHSDGSTRWIHDRAFPIRDDAGNVYRMAGISQDITERKWAEDQVRLTQAELAHIGRLAAVGELATGIAHELNQPLGAIVNYSAAAANRLASPDVDRDDLAEALCEIAKEAERAGQIIQRLRRFIRRSEPKRSTVFLKTMIDDMIALVMNHLRHEGVRLHVEVPDDLTVVADSVQIQQVILNLVCNAVEAMAEVAAGARELTITASAGRGMVQVAVDDTGPGFDAEAKERIFEHFFTTKQEGLGMGLTISRRIIRAHGGRIWTEGDRDQGARILFTLPVGAE